MSRGDACHPNLDAIERCLFKPFDKLSNAFRKSDQSTIDEKRHEAVTRAVQYMTQNDLADVHVSVRDYHPIDQWRRLVANDDMHPLWKYTDGSLRVLTSTVLPERVFRLDRYNPHTKTLHLNSVHPTSAVYAAATAKDFLGSSTPGLYAATQYIPILPIWQQVKITRDSIGYARVNQDWQLERKLYPKAYARIGSSVLSDAYSLAPATSSLPFFVSPAISLAGRVLGRAAGELHVRRRSKERALEKSLVDPLVR